MGHRSSRTLLAAPVLALVLIGLVPARALAASVFVDCSGATPGAFATITAALATLNREVFNIITVKGSCVEPVTIAGFTTRTLLQADPAGASIEWTGAGSAIDIFRSFDVTISGFSIRGRPVRISGSSVVDLTSVTIEQSSGAGISAAIGSTIVIRSSVVQQNAQGLSIEPGVLVRIRDVTIRNNTGSGVLARGANLDVEGALTVEENGGSGLDLGGGFARFNSGAGPNVIRANGGIGLNAAGTTVTFSGGNVIQNNGSTGIQASHGGSLQFTSAGSGPSTQATLIEGNESTGLNIAASGSATFNGPHQIRGNRGGGMRVGSVSRVEFNGQSEISGNQGPGVLTELNSVAVLGGTVISNNAEEGVQTLRNAIANLESAVISGNGVAAVTCDATALVIAGTSSLAGAVKCGRIERAHGPPRPGAIIVR